MNDNEAIVFVLLRTQLRRLEADQLHDVFLNSFLIAVVSPTPYLLFLFVLYTSFLHLVAQKK